MKRLISFILVLTFIFSAVDMSASATGEYYIFSFDEGIVGASGLCGSQYTTTRLKGTYQLTTNDESLDIRAWAVAATGIKEVKYNFNDNGWEVLPETAFSACPDIYDAATGTYGLAVIEQNVTVAPLTPEFRISIPVYDLGLILDSTYTFQIQIVTNAGEEILIADLTIPYVEYYVSTEPQSWKTRGNCHVALDGVSATLNSAPATADVSTSKVTYNYGKVDTINFFGWMSVDQEAEWSTAFGYSVDDGEIVYGMFGAATGQDVIDAGAYDYDSRFDIYADVTDLTPGIHTLNFYCRLSNGEQIILNSLTVDVLASEDTRTIVLEGSCGDNVDFILYDDGELVIFGMGDMTDYGYGDAPWYSIRSSVKSVIIGDSVTSIGDRAFYECSSLTSVTIPDSVTSIGDYAFDSCDSLTSVTIPDSVTSIGYRAFYDCDNLTSVTIPESVTSIGESAFEWCENLTSVTISDSVISIGSLAFHGCSSLTSITVDVNNEYYASDEYGVLFNKDKTTLIQYPIGNARTSYVIPDSVTSIGDHAFYDCSRLTSVTIGDSVTSIGESAFEWCGNLTSVTIGDSVTSIGYCAFYYCDSLTSVTIGNSVTVIGDYAFYYCDSLTSVTIGNSVTVIGDYAFSWCSSLTDVYYNGSEAEWAEITIGSGNDSLINANIIYVIENEIVASGTCGENLTWTIESDGTLTISGTGDMTDYSSLSSVPWFSNRSSVERVVIENGVASIGDWAFYDCSSITSITILDSIITIGIHAFESCDDLAIVEIGNGVTSIGSYAFMHCRALATVKIGNNVISIGEDAFYNCSSIKDVYYNGSEADWNDISIGNNNASLLNATIHFSYEDGKYIVYVNSTSEFIFDGVTVNKLSADLNESSYLLLEDGNNLVVDLNGHKWTSSDSVLRVAGGSCIAKVYDSSAAKTGAIISTSNDAIAISGGVLELHDITVKGGDGNMDAVWVEGGKVTIKNCTLSAGKAGLDADNVSESAGFPAIITVYGGKFADYDGMVGDRNCAIELRRSGANGPKVTLIGDIIFENDNIMIRNDYTKAVSEGIVAGENDTVSFGGLNAVAGRENYNTCKIVYNNSVNDDTVIIIGSGFCGENLTWTLDSEGTLTISGTGDMTDYGYGDAPWYSNLLSVKKVVIENGVTSIGDYAFCDSSNLIFAIIPISVTNIGDYVFCGLSNLDRMYYVGDMEDWHDIYIGSNNSSLANTNIFFNCIDSDVASKWSNTVYVSYDEIRVPDGNGSVYCDRDASKVNFFTAPNGTERVSFWGWIAADYSEIVGFSYNINDFAKISDPSFKKEPEQLIIDANYGEYTSRFLIETQLIQGTQNVSLFVDFEDGTSEKIWTCEVTVNKIVQTGSCGDGVSFTLYDDGELVIFGEGDMKDYSSLTTAPWYENCSFIKNVTIKDGVERVGNYSFYDCSNIERVFISHCIESIGDSAFYGCARLREVHYAGNKGHWNRISIASNNDYLINANIVCAEWFNTIHVSSDEIRTDIGIGNVVCNMDEAKINYFSAPNITKEILFWGWVSADRSDIVSFSYSINGGERIKNISFKHETEQAVIDAGPGMYDSRFLIKVRVQEGTQNVRLYVDFEDGTSEAIWNCEVTIRQPASVVECDSFGNNLTWTLDTEGILTISGEGDMENYSSITEIPWYNYRSDVKMVIIENGVTSIGSCAFYRCSNLRSVTIPDSVTSIGNWAFYYCESLTSVTIPDSVTSIGNWAFYICSSLTSVTIPDSVTSIGGYAFDDCYSLTSITVDENNKYYSNDEYGVLFNKDKTTLIRYPIGNARTSYVIPGGVTSIGDYAFYDCSNLTSVTIPDSVTSIGDSAFYDCSNLTSVTIPDSVTSIGNYAFEYCESLTSITIPDSVTIIGDYAFYDCSSLTSVTIPDSVTSIGHGAFGSCESLTSVTIPDSVTSIGDWAFYDCSSLTSVTISDSVTSIGDGAFERCDKLTDVYYSGSEAEWAEWAEITIGSGNDPLINANIHFEKEECEHDYGEWEITTAPGCETEGEKQKVCSLCGDVVTEVIPANGHSMKETVISPTCTEEGYTHHYCENCAYAYDDTYVDALGHSYGDWVTDEAPTCTAEGKRHKVCGECGHTVYESVEKVDHEYEQKIIPPTYFEEGYTVYTCSACGHTYNDNYVDVLKRIELSDAVLELEYNSVYYKGVALTPDVSLIYNGETHDPAVELKITYLNNDKVGTATVIVEGINKFKGTVELKFEISYETIPEKIVNFVAIGEIGKISLSWGQSSEVSTDSYNIYRKADGESDYQLIKTIVGRTELYFEDTNVEKRETYSYYITGVGLYGAESEPSLIATATVLVDEIAPTVMKMTPVAASVISKKVTLSATVTDNIGVAKVVYFYSVDNGATWIKIGESTNKAFSVVFDVSELESGALNVKAIAYDAEGNESDPFAVAYSLDNTGPDKVTGLSAVALSSKITLSWNDVEANDAAYFILQVKSGDEWKTVANNIKTLGYVVNNLQANTDYTYRVACVDARGNIGEYSDEFTARTVLDQTAPVITNQSPNPGRYNSTIRFSATAKDDCDINIIEIQISTDLLSWTTVSKKIFTVQTYSQTYTYTIDLGEYSDGSIFVRAIATDFSGNISDTSSTAPYTEYVVDKTAPVKPAGVTASGNDGYITVSWNMGSEADIGKYFVYRATSSDGEYQLIYSNLSSINYHDRNVQRETYYYYKIKVSDACGNMSEFSDVVSAKMSADTQKPEITSISTTYQQKISKKNNTISISATDNNRLSYIAVEYCTSVDSDYVLLAMEESIDSNYKNISVVLPVESLTDGDIVYIRAYAVDMAGNKSGYATQKYTLDTTPPMISDFTASLDTSNVYLNWQDCGDDDLAGFRVYRSGDGENFVQLGARGVNNSGSYSFIDTINEKEDNVYIYKLEAVDKIGNTATWTKSVEYEYVYINQIPVPVIDIPGSMAVGVEEVFDASKSTDDIVIVSYLWNFGDGTTSDEIKPAKSYEKTGVYTVTLSITDNEGITSTITKEVTVKERDLLGTLNVRITDENDKSLPYVPVYFDLGSSDQKIVYTDASGVATLQMLSGSHTIGMYTSGYLPVKKDVVVLANATRTVTLTTVKEDIVTGNFEITRMDFDEILAAGIDVYDPANQNVYAANVRVTYGSTPPITIKYVRNDSKVLEFGIVDSNGKLIDHFTNGNGETRVITGITYIPTPSRGEGDVVAIMDMPAEASYLKEFFDVRLHIINNASSEFTLEMNEVLLNVPNGMTLMNSVSGDYLTSNIANIPSIRGQETVTLAWVLRGDKAGEYDLSADFTGILSDFNELVTARFETEKPIKVYGLEGVKFRILTADKIYNDTLYFNIELENERDIDIYMPSIGLTGKIKNVTESVLNENVDGDFLAEAYILNAYIQSPNGNKQYLPVTYDENGKANTNIKVLAPGQKLVYEYVAYNAINYAGIAYFKEAAVLEFEGMIENIEVGSFSKDYYSFNDYTAKLDTILGATDPAVNEAFDYMMTDYNFYYVSEARGLNVSALESLYKFGDTVINFDLSSLTNAEERDLVKRIILSLLSERSIIEQSNDLMLYEYNKAAIAMIKDIEGGILTNFIGCDEDLIKIKDAFKDFLNDSMDFAVTYKTEGLKGFKNKIDQDLAKKIGKDINISDELITKYNDIKAFSDVIGIGVDVLDTIFSSVNDAKRESCYFALLKLKCNEEISKCVLDKVIEFSKEGALREFNEKVLTGLIAPTIGFNGFIANGLGVEMNTIIYQEAVSMRKDLEKSISSFDEKLETVKNLVLNGSIKGAEAILGKVISSAIGSTPMILISLGFNVLDGLLGWENYVKQHDTLQVYDTFSEVFIKAFIDNSKTRGHDEDYHTMFFLHAVCEIRLGGEAQFIKFITDYSEGKYRMPISDATILKMLLSDKRYTSVDAWIDNMQYNLVHSRDILFNVEKISEIETPRAPVVTLDYDKLQTVQSFTSEYEYCFADGVWIKCNNEPIAFSVGVTPSVLRVRKAASDTNFVGNITTVKIFARKDLSKLITVKFDGINYMFDNLSPQRNYQVVFTDDSEADIDWATAQTISGSNSTVMISGVKEYSNVIIRSCQNSELQETTSNPLSLAVSKKKLLNLIIDGSGAVSQTDDSGCYFNGESIDLVADANTGNDFIGWFIDGVCVSSDEHYIVEMYDGLEIVAQFTGVKIKSISIENLPVKLNYYEGEDLDFYGLKLLIKYSDDTTAYAEEFIGYLTSNTVGTSTVIITYGGFTASYDITIDHNESDWITTMNPTIFDEGLKIKRCSHCHKVTEAEVIPMLADETGIVVDNDNHLIYNIPEELLDSDSIITHYDDLGCRIKVLDADSETTDSLMTGGYIVYAGTKYAVVVSGDITGDGEIDIFDVLGMLDHVNGDAELEGVYEKAGLVVNGEEIDIFDALAVLDRVNSDA